MSLAEIMGTEVQEKEEFIVDTFEKADWAINKMAVAESNIQKLTRRYKDYLDKLKTWYDSEIKPFQETINNLGEMIRPYCLQTVLANKGKKSVSFPQGTAQFRASKSLAVDNDDNVIEWLQENDPDKIVIKKSFKKNDIKDLIKNGVDVPGCSISEKENFSVEIKPIESLLR